MKNDSDDGKKRPDSSTWAALALLGQVGFTIMFFTLLGIGIGLFMDHRFNSTPIATLIGLLLGLAAGVYGVYRLVSSTES